MYRIQPQAKWEVPATSSKSASMLPQGALSKTHISPETFSVTPIKVRKLCTVKLSLPKHRFLDDDWLKKVIQNVILNEFSQGAMIQ